MFDKFLKLINQYTPLSQEEIHYLRKIRSYIPIKTFKKNEIIFREREYFHTMYLILEGSVRLYYNVDGNDKTAFFYTEGKFICAGESFTYNVPANENYQALEDTTLMFFHENTLEDLVKLFPNFKYISRLVIEDELITSQNMVASFITKSPEERYLELIETNCELFQRVHQHYIASYLGVSPETLSRIKKRTILKDKKVNS